MLLHLLGLLAGQCGAYVRVKRESTSLFLKILVLLGYAIWRGWLIWAEVRRIYFFLAKTIGGKIRGKCLETPDTCPPSCTTLVFLRFPHKYRTTRNGWLIWENENALYSTDTQHNTSEKVRTKNKSKSHRATWCGKFSVTIDCVYPLVCVFPFCSGRI